MGSKITHDFLTQQKLDGGDQFETVAEQHSDKSIGNHTEACVQTCMQPPCAPDAYIYLSYTHTHTNAHIRTKEHLHHINAECFFLAWLQWADCGLYLPKITCWQQWTTPLWLNKFLARQGFCAFVSVSPRIAKKKKKRHFTWLIYSISCH